MAENLEWKWLIVQLDNNTELLFRHVLYNDFTFSDLFIFDENASGTNIERLVRGQYYLKTLDDWTDPATSQTYPIAWLLEIPPKNISLKINSLMENQTLSPILYEGTCQVDGFYNDISIGGRAQFENKKLFQP